MANVQKSTIIGQQFGYLTISEVLNRDKSGNLKVIAVCVCGNKKEYFFNNIRRKGHTTSCGCMKASIISEKKKTHGLTNHLLYGRWEAMKRRCYVETSDDYSNYGGKGVIVCDEWKDNFKSYYDWCIRNGWQKGMDIDKDKIGTGLLYSPETCCIITSKENQNNRGNNIYVIYKNETMTLKQLAEKYNIKYHLLWTRYVKYKWGIEKAILTPPKTFKCHT